MVSLNCSWAVSAVWRVRASSRLMAIGAPREVRPHLRLPLGRRRELVERENVAKNLADLRGETGARGGRGLHLAAHDPALEPLPVLGLRGPAILLGPFAFFHRIPVTIVLLLQAPRLPRQPGRVFPGARSRRARQPGLAALAVHAEAGGDSVGRNADVELPVVAVGSALVGECQVHLRAVGRLVCGEADIAVDAREVAARATADIKFRVQLQRRGRQGVEQRAQRLDHLRAIALAVLVHPGLVVVAPELAEEAKRLRAEDCGLGGHSPPRIRAKKTDSTIPCTGQSGAPWRRKAGPNLEVALAAVKRNSYWSSLGTVGRGWGSGNAGGASHALQPC